ncbi:MAG TPA: GTP cyclohydrolase II, partial [Steroidobacteraceae bacterium]|nr:GTP cyclohydrolase II [Steroidobacteraceae bacterium]
GPGLPPQMLEVSIDDIAAYERPEAEHLERVSEARVPLAGHPDCRLVLYRDDRDGTEHVAVLIGSVDAQHPVPVRLHSSCLTGDLLGSLRCDCGEQLRGAVERLADAGGGVLLYLAQEGRGIGLANKLRAYTLQDTGLDTLDADQHLGFEPDERTYESASSILRDLGITRIRLYTNNPRKVAALQESGIEVVERVQIGATVNPHNERYIRTKQERAGHYTVDEG